MKWLVWYNFLRFKILQPTATADCSVGMIKDWYGTSMTYTAVGFDIEFDEAIGKSYLP